MSVASVASVAASRPRLVPRRPRRERRRREAPSLSSSSVTTTAAASSSISEASEVSVVSVLSSVSSCFSSRCMARAAGCSCGFLRGFSGISMGSSTGSSWRMRPRPPQCSHSVEKVSSRPVPRRLRVIWTRPREVTSETWWRVRSRPRASLRRRRTSSWFSGRTMSMKSTTIMPPRSRRRIWRTISSAASRLLRVTVSSRLPPEPVNLPVLTSTTVMASVRSMTREPPEGSHTLRLRAFCSCSSTRKRAKASTPSCSERWYFCRRSSRSGATDFT